MPWDIFEKICGPVPQRDRKRGETPASCVWLLDYPEQIPVFGLGACGVSGRQNIPDERKPGLLPENRAGHPEMPELKKQEYQDNTDRIEVEWFFSWSKRCFGMGLIVTKFVTIQLTLVALSTIVSNLFRFRDGYSW